MIYWLVLKMNEPNHDWFSSAQISINEPDLRRKIKKCELLVVRRACLFELLLLLLMLLLSFPCRTPDIGRHRGFRAVAGLQCFTMPRLQKWRCEFSNWFFFFFPPFPHNYIFFWFVLSLFLTLLLISLTAWTLCCAYCSNYTPSFLPSFLLL